MSVFAGFDGASSDHGFGDLGYLYPYLTNIFKGLDLLDAESVTLSSV